MDDDQVEYTFNTAWSPPEGVIEKLREQYPDVKLQLSMTSQEWKSQDIINGD
jgi:hypothetical protein